MSVKDTFSKSWLPVTFFKTKIDIDGVSSTIAWGGIDASEDHIQNEATSTTSAILLAAPTAAESIVIRRLHIGSGSQHSQSNTYPSFVGTLGASGCSNDIIRYSVGMFGLDINFEGPWVLPKGKALVHYQVKGPMGSIPNSHLFNYVMNIEYGYTEEPPTIDCEPYAGEGEGGGDPPPLE